jgi:hypothetical protein
VKFAWRAIHAICFLQLLAFLSKIAFFYHDQSYMRMALQQQIRELRSVPIAFDVATTERPDFDPHLGWVFPNREVK